MSAVPENADAGLPEDPTVTAWIRRMQRGDSEAAPQLWREYYGKLVVLARRKLEGRAALVADEEDVALSRLVQEINANRFPLLAVAVECSREQLGMEMVLNFRIAITNVGGAPAFNLRTTWEEEGRRRDNPSTILATTRSGRIRRWGMYRW